MRDRYNFIADVIRILGWCSLGFGFLLGIISGTETNQVLSGISFVIYGIISCVFFLGFSEVISLLQGIYNQGIKDEPLVPNLATPAILEEVPDIPPATEGEIREFYAAGNLKPTSIEGTVIEDVYKIVINGEVQYVELGGFKPKVLTKTDFNNRL